MCAVIESVAWIAGAALFGVVGPVLAYRASQALGRIKPWQITFYGESGAAWVMLREAQNRHPLLFGVFVATWLTLVLSVALSATACR